MTLTMSCGSLHLFEGQPSRRLYLFNPRRAIACWPWAGGQCSRRALATTTGTGTASGTTRTVTCYLSVYHYTVDSMCTVALVRTYYYYLYIE